MLPRGKRQEEVQICGEDCRYRKLYEGSQRSLTEMASRQAQAVSRVGRLRNQLVLAAKRSFPRAFGEAERSIGKRLSETSDEILVAYLENFMGSSVLAEEPEGASDLRQALGELGVLIPPGVDLREWAQAVRRHAPTIMADTTPVAPQPAPRIVAPMKPAVVANRDLLIETPRQSVPTDQELDLDDLFEPVAESGAGVQSNPSVVPNTPETTDLGSELAMPEVQQLSMGKNSTRNTDTTEGHPFEEDLGGVAGETEDMFSVFADEEIGSGAFTEGGSGLPVESFFDDTEDTMPAVAVADGLNHGPDSVPPRNGEPSTANRTIERPKPAEAAQPVETVVEPLPAWQAGRTVKPQLFPPAPSGGRGPKREKRAIRSRAIPADMPDVPVEHQTPTGPAALNDQTRHQLLAAVSVPRPVFTSDLAGVVGSEELVSAWREELQNGDLTVRFVLPKPRHKLRGSLVIPQTALAGANSEFARSHWARCMEAYRGARIYELGVFFHRFGEQVISFESDGEVVAVRMSLPSGLTGAVLVAGQDLANGGATRSSLCGALERLLQDRLVHIAVLVLNAEQFDAVAGLLDNEARGRGWQASMPVTLSRSWEYVDGTGTAVPLLGV
jgi:hypothetical protein